MAEKIKKPYSMDDFLDWIIEEVGDAVDFIDQEFSDDFETADRYFNGEVDIIAEEGRSGVVSTQVRDSIRNMRPSIMRVLLKNKQRMIEYVPDSLAIASAMRQQQSYAHQLFWANNGYQVLYDCIDESLKHRIGPVKTYWDENPAPEYAYLTMLTLDEVQFVSEMDHVEILNIIKNVPSEGEAPLLEEDEVEFYDVECVNEANNGRIRIDAVPYGEFIISRNARGIADASLHGHRRSVTVSEAIEMGLDHEDWFALDDFDPEQSEVEGVTDARLGYQKREEPERGDVLGHRFLLTEVYVYLDLEDLGYNQLYEVTLGGTSYELLDYMRVTESPFDLVRHDPKAFSSMGTSLADIAVPQQDIITSVLRGMVDNLHLANTPRFGANPSQVNFDDMMNHQIGHPIRFKSQGSQVQVIEVASQLQSTLPMLGWLEQDAQNKMGVTKASQGLDPNAMQSTDKQAVQNTIQMAMGQVELAVRNIVETGLIGIFRKLLKLSVYHLDRQQITKMGGQWVPVDQLLFNPSAHAECLVGLGAVSDEMRVMGLQMTFERQMMIYQSLGINNPFVSATNIYNTLEDMTEAYGLYDVSRYFNQVTPEVEQQFAQQRAEQMAQEAAAQKGQQVDPAMAVIESEKIRAGSEKLKALAQARGKSLELQLKALEAERKDDLERDKMNQDRILKSAQLVADTGTKVDELQIKKEQAAKRTTVPSGGES